MWPEDPWLDPRVHIHKIAAAAGVLAVVSVLSACAAPSDVEDVVEPGSSASVAATPAPAAADPAEEDEAEAEDGGPCDLVDAETVSELAEREIDTPRETVVGALPACQWHGADVSLQVAQVPAVDWAVSLPAIIAQVRQSDGVDDATLARFDEAEELIESGAVDPAAACDMFSMMTEISGHEPGTDRSINLVPDAQAPQAISGQACVDGVYSSVLFVAPGLSADSPKVSAVDVVLNKVIAAGV